MFEMGLIKSVGERYGSQVSALDDAVAAEMLVVFLTYLEPAKRARVVLAALAALAPEGRGGKEYVLSYLWREGIPGGEIPGDKDT